MNLFFIYHDRPNYFGGPIVNARRLLPELVSYGHNVYCLLFYSGSEASSVYYLRSKGVKCFDVQLPLYTEYAIKIILNLIVEIDPDIFVPNLSVAGWYASRWVRDTGIPTIACHRSDDSFHWAMVDEFVLGKKIWSVNGLVCVSAYLSQKVLEGKPYSTKVCTIPSGVPFTTEKVNQEGPLRLVYVGRLVDRQKQILKTVAAIAQVLRFLPNATATLIGEGNKRKEIETKISNLGLEKRFKILGTFPPDEIQDKLMDYNIIVLLSDYEGTPGAVMDGMARGLVPVCLSVPGGVQELVKNEETGLLVDDREDNFLRAILRLDENDELREFLSINAKNHIKENFSLHKAARLWERFFFEIVKEKKDGSIVKFPLIYDLPPVKKGLGREDFRIKKIHKIFPYFFLKKIKRIATKKMS